MSVAERQKGEAHGLWQVGMRSSGAATPPETYLDDVTVWRIVDSPHMPSPPPSVATPVKATGSDMGMAPPYVSSHLICSPLCRCHTVSPARRAMSAALRSP